MKRLGHAACIALFLLLLSRAVTFAGDLIDTFTPPAVDAWLDGRGGVSLFFVAAIFTAWKAAKPAPSEP
jgi:hypothetical protein